MSTKISTTCGKDQAFYELETITVNIS